MIPSLIFGISLLALLQFFVSYCHALIAESRGFELSEQARQISGIMAKVAHGDQFQRLRDLIALCPEPGGDRNQVMAVSTYFGMLNFVRTFFSWALPSATQWIESELAGCAYVAAVMLDRRISFNRLLIAQQTGSRP